MNQTEEIVDAQWAGYEPRFARIQCKHSGAQLAGKRYEASALRYLNQKHKHMIPLPWLQYRFAGDSQWRWCQPDALIFDFLQGQIYIVECKLRHTAKAFTKIRDLYWPIISALFPDTLWHVAGVEFTRAFDCAVKIPVEAEIYEEVTKVPEGVYGVVIWNPARTSH